MNVSISLKMHVTMFLNVVISAVDLKEKVSIYLVYLKNAQRKLKKIITYQDKITV